MQALCLNLQVLHFVSITTQYSLRHARAPLQLIFGTIRRLNRMLYLATFIRF